MILPPALTAVAADVARLVLPRECLGCGRAGRSLCVRCARGALGDVARRDPDPRPAGLPPAWSAAVYADLVRDAVLAHKERGDRGLTAPLAAALAAAVRAGCPAGAAGPIGPISLVPVPTARRAVVRRGDDTVLLLARAAAARLPARVAPVLATARRRHDQAGLGSAARAANLAGAFRVRRRVAAGLSHGAVVVVDDVITTGSTLGEAVRALRSAGVPVAAVVTVAATPRRTGDGGRSRPVRRGDQG